MKFLARRSCSRVLLHPVFFSYNFKMFTLFRLRVLAGIFACMAGNALAEQPVVKDGWADGEAAIKKFKTAPGLKMELFAAEPQLLNPVALSVDEKGRVFVVETFRLHAGVTDIRSHMDWLDTDLACRTTEDLADELKKYLHGADFAALTNNSEKVQLVEDRNGDGKADHATVFAEGFNSIVDGIAAGVLARKGEVYFANIPNLWLLRDTKGTGQADFRKSLAYGFGVRTSFLGHDLHGLRMGPDGKLYCSIGDRGFNVKTAKGDGAHPETGGVLRCNPDGSDLEVFAFGLRNPQHLAFDDYGNLFTGDNNCDSGDQARWVYVVEGGNSGWHVGYQSLEAPRSRGPWNSEKMWYPPTDDQPAYIVPPVANVADGPSGVTYYPGVGLPENYKGHFFLTDFRGGENSLIHSFAVKAKGAGFEMVDHQEFLRGMLVTDAQFGPDSALYITDWVEGWGMPSKGRIYKMFSPELRQSTLVLETKKIIGEGMEGRSAEELARLLSHPDQRVRQEAQFALADKGASSVKILRSVTQQRTNQLARIHAIWGLGQIGRAKSERSSALKPLLPLLQDGDAEIRAQAARVLGDAKFSDASGQLRKMAAGDNSDRVKYFATMALGKIGGKKGIEPVLEMLRANNDVDAFLRHAGVMALIGLGDAALTQASHDYSPAVRMAALLAMRRMHRADIAMFLEEDNQRLVTEAARAINDEPINEAMPQLAKLITKSNYAEPLFSRVLNANFRTGTEENAAALAKAAANHDIPETMRADALDLLAQWAKPSGRDHIVNLWRPLTERDGQVAVRAISPVLDKILRHSPSAVQLAALNVAKIYSLQLAEGAAFNLVTTTNQNTTVRVEALKLLAQFKSSKLAEAVKFAAADAQEDLRKEATTLLAQLDPADATAMLSALLERGSTGERQNALLNLGIVKDNSANTVLSQWLNKLATDQLPKELQLDLLEAAQKRNVPPLIEQLNKLQLARANDELAPYRAALFGGNADEGKKIFFDRADVSCVRCHKVGTTGGDVGPNLTGIGTRQPREYILESVIFPNKQIAAGFESYMVTMKDGSVHAGVTKKESEQELVLNSAEDGVVTLKKADIEKQKRSLSPMPEGLGAVLSKRDLRNLVEFLATQK